MLLCGPQEQMQAGKLPKTGAGVVVPLICCQPLVGLTGAPSCCRRSCLKALCTGLLQGLRHGPQLTVVRGQVSIHVRRPGLAEETFLDQSVAELWVVDQDLGVEKIQSLKPFLKPGISCCGVCLHILNLFIPG